MGGVHCDGVDVVSDDGESVEELMCSTGGSYFSDSGGGRTSSAAADSAIATPSGSSSSSIISKESSDKCNTSVHTQLTFSVDLWVLSEAILHVLEFVNAVYTLRFVLRVDKARESFAELRATRSMGHST